MEIARAIRHGRGAALLLWWAAAASAAPALPPIEASEWRLTALRDIDSQTLAAIPGGVRVRFADGRLQGFGGCNRLAGSYTVAGDRLELGALAGTMMACPPPAADVETAFHRAFRGPFRFAIADGVLRLTPATAGDPSLIFAALPPPRLDGVEWSVTGYNNGRQAVVSPASGTRLTLTFANGAVSGSAGCNTFRAGYTVNGTRIAIDAPVVTRRHCAGEVMQQERAFLAALQSATTWTLDGRALDLHRADGERVVHATSGATRTEGLAP